MIEIQHLSAGYAGKAILRDISLTFPQGQITVIAGPNGCGKSTLLRTVLKLLPKLEGRIFYDGIDSDTLSGREIALHAAFLAQSRNVPEITAERMVLHGRFPHLSFPRHYGPGDKEIVVRAMETAGAAGLEHRLVSQLSGGQRQRVYLAMALAQETNTIFMDEPTTFMDVRHQLDTMKTARALAQQGKALVMVLHDLCLALQTADRLVILDQGQIRIQGTPEEVLSSGVLREVFGVCIRRVKTDHGWRCYYDE